MQSDIEQLKDKLVTGRNEQRSGFQNFVSGQFYENVTREKYAGFRGGLSYFDSSRDLMNPSINTSNLQWRLGMIEHYKYRYGADHTYWVHAVLRRANARVMKYKWNYLAKTFLAY